MNDQEKRDPKEVFERAIADYYEVMIHLCDHAELDVPLVARPGKGKPVLVYGMDQAKPIPDLEITDAGIKATLSFSNEPVATFVPWGAIDGMMGIGERPKQRTQLRAV